MDGDNLYQAYISLYRKWRDAYIKPISAYITGWGTPISSLYQAYISLYRKCVKVGLNEPRRAELNQPIPAELN